MTSPLAEIERLAQERADELALDLSRPDGPDRLRRLVVDAVGRWNGEHREGRRDVALGDDVVERALRNLVGYGPLGPLLEDDDVWEIMVNAPDALFVRRHRGPDGPHDDVFHDDDHVLRVLTRILDDATGAHRKLDPTLGLQDAQLEDGARLHIVHRDLSRGGHTMVNIRKFTGVAYRRLPELVATGMLDTPTADLLATFVRAGASMVVSGRPGAGKTTLLACCVAELDPRRRVVVAEEVFEADVPVANVIAPLSAAAVLSSLELPVGLIERCDRVEGGSVVAERLNGLPRHSFGLVNGQPFASVSVHGQSEHHGFIVLHALKVRRACDTHGSPRTRQLRALL
jgi:pilus assembly protein CpaF